ncbi:hypothetical protein BJ508DRAFT_326815 [Ascobolus immersus RN42]|uniref:F-box domain-containing protein n=1 Tax=Ascobolus immersus RN42 TaxID=1160509 RepID=A0A3N4I6A5_ASCIM|nr:hypothetical protein BJ508DRAFT_326815 [Ascobolus immersus RN42]
MLAVFLQQLLHKLALYFLARLLAHLLFHTSSYQYLARGFGFTFRLLFVPLRYTFLFVLQIVRPTLKIIFYPVKLFRSEKLSPFFRLTDLPLELRLEVYDQCTAFSLLQLSQTSRSVREEILARPIVYSSTEGYYEQSRQYLISLERRALASPNTESTRVTQLLSSERRLLTLSDISHVTSEEEKDLVYRWYGETAAEERRRIGKSWMPIGLFYAAGCWVICRSCGMFEWGGKGGTHAIHVCLDCGGDLKWLPRRKAPHWNGHEFCF